MKVSEALKFNVTVTSRGYYKVRKRVGQSCWGHRILKLLSKLCWLPWECGVCRFCKTSHLSKSHFLAIAAAGVNCFYLLTLFHICISVWLWQSPSIILNFAGKEVWKIQLLESSPCDTRESKKGKSMGTKGHSTCSTKGIKDQWRKKKMLSN